MRHAATLPLLVVGLAMLLPATLAAEGDWATASNEAGAPRQATATASDTTYRVLLLRAAPGRLDDLIGLFRDRFPVLDAAQIERPVIMRHSQGDQWDLMLLFPTERLAEYFGEARGRRLAAAAQDAGFSEADFQDSLRDLVAFREELFAAGPPHEDLAERARGAGLYHIEMFVAVAGRYDDLVEQRHMENAYYHATDREGNLVFTRLAGAQWDVFTVGFYDDMSHFASEPDLPREQLEQAAIDAGFESRGTIGTYLRELMHHHNDTLAVPIR